MMMTGINCAPKKVEWARFVLTDSDAVWLPKDWVLHDTTDGAFVFEGKSGSETDSTIMISYDWAPPGKTLEDPLSESEKKAVLEHRYPAAPLQSESDILLGGSKSTKMRLASDKETVLAALVPQRSRLLLICIGLRLPDAKEPTATQEQFFQEVLNRVEIDQLKLPAKTPVSEPILPASASPPNPLRYMVSHDGWWPYFNAQDDVIWWPRDWKSVFTMLPNHSVALEGTLSSGQQIRFFVHHGRATPTGPLIDYFRQTNVDGVLQNRSGSAITVMEEQSTQLGHYDAISQRIRYAKDKHESLIEWAYVPNGSKLLGLELESVTPGEQDAEAKELFHQIISRFESFESGQSGQNGEHFVPYLIENLTSPNFGIANQAASNLLKIGNLSVPYLAQALREGTDPLRVRVRTLLTKMNTADAISALQTSPSPMGGTASELPVGSEFESFIQTLSASSPSTDQRSYLRHYGLLAATQLFDATYRYPDRSIHSKAYALLRTMDFAHTDNQEIETLRRHPSNPHLNLDYVLLNISAPQDMLILVLVEAISESDMYLGAQSPMGLGFLAKSHETEFRTLLKTEDPILSAGAAEGLVFANIMDEEVINRLLKGLQSVNESERAICARTFLQVRLSDPALVAKAIPVLISVLGDEYSAFSDINLQQYTIGTWASQALGTMGSAGVPELLKAAQDGTPKVKTRAEEALRTINILAGRKNH